MTTIQNNSFEDYDVNPKNFILDEKEAAEARKDGYTWAKKGMSATIFNAYLQQEISLKDKIFQFSIDKSNKEIDDKQKQINNLCDLAKLCKDPDKLITYLKEILSLKENVNELQFAVAQKEANKLDEENLVVPYRTGWSALY